MRYGSVCSGIEAATQAWHPLGWVPSFLSEIDPFPRAVLQHHMPDVPLRGDFTEIQDCDHDPIDLLVGGTPCQSFSVAGLRGGLGDERGNLALEYFRLAQRLRPRWVVWENVPGVLSSNKGRDFGAILGALEQLGYGWAYRTLDAQYVRTRIFSRAVPQRRRRVFVVGCLGGWTRAAAVLFDAKSLRGDPPPSRKQGNGFAPQASPCLRARSNDAHRIDMQAYVAEPAIAFDCSGSQVWNSSSGVMQTLRARHTGHAAVAFDMRGREGGAVLEGPHNTANIRAASGGSSRSYVAHPYAVRRLTPTECERLQGFPDEYTNIPWRGKNNAPDGRRYKALGNSMAVNVMEWIGHRIQMIDAI
jgi:DNA (cytosine-5)-methyltransferase 1